MRVINERNIFNPGYQEIRQKSIEIVGNKKIEPVKKKVKKEPDIKEFVKQESLFEYHSESMGFPGDRFDLTAPASFSAYYGNFGAEFLNGASHFMNPLIVADAVGDRKSCAM